MSAHVDLGQQVFDNISSQIVFAILSTQPDQRSSTLCMKTEGDSIILYPFYGFSELRIKVAPQNITIHLVNKNLCGPSTSKLILTGQITGSADEPKIYVDHIDLAHLSGEYRFIFKAIDSSFGGVLRVLRDLVRASGSGVVRFGSGAWENCGQVTKGAWGMSWRQKRRRGSLR